MQKKCCRCKNLKDLSEFYKNKNMKDGHGNYCKLCTKSSSKVYYQKKNKYDDSESSDIIKLMLLSNYSTINDEKNENKNINLIMIEKLCHAILDEVKKLKQDLKNIESIP